MFIIQLKLYYLHNPIIRRYSGHHKWDNVLRCIFNQTEIPNGKKKVQQGIEGSNSTWCNKKSKNDSMIVRHRQVKSITLDEIEGAYKITTIHVGLPSYFLWDGVWLWRIKWELLGDCLTLWRIKWGRSITQLRVWLTFLVLLNLMNFLI
jgi:hypothetical protein